METHAFRCCNSAWVGPLCSKSCHDLTSQIPHISPTSQGWWQMRGKCVANAWQMRGKWHEALVIFQGVIGFRDGLTTAADKHHSNILPIVAFGLLTCSHPCAPSHVGSCKVQMPCIRRQGVCIHGQFRSQFPLPPDGQAKKFCQ